MSPLPLLSDTSVDDPELVRRIANHDEAAFEIVMRRHNGALYRIARAILKNTADAEDVLQESYLSAFRHIADFRADAKLSTWLTRIVVNQALARRRSRQRSRIVVPFSQLHAGERISSEPVEADDSTDSPEQSTSRAEIRRLLERKIEDLPVAFQTVFMLREVDEFSGAETAECLSDHGSDGPVAAVPRPRIAARAARARAGHEHPRCLPLRRRALRPGRGRRVGAPPRRGDTRRSGTRRVRLSGRRGRCQSGNGASRRYI